MAAWLPSGRDVYGIALQEALDPQQVAEEVQRHLGRNYITISHAIGNANTQLGYHGFISVLVCVHERLISAGVALPSVAQRREVRLGRNLVVTRAGNKGAVAVVLPLRLPDAYGMLTRLSSFTFVACHLASDSKGASKLASRNGDAAAMLAGLQIGFPTGALLTQPEAHKAGGAPTVPPTAASQRGARSVSMGPMHTAAAEAADAALNTPPSSDDEGGLMGTQKVVGFTSGSGDSQDALRPLLAGSEEGSTSGSHGDSTERGRSSTLFFPLGRGDSVIRGRQGTTGSAAPSTRASMNRQQMLSIGTRNSAVSTVRFFTGDVGGSEGKRSESPEPFPSDSPFHEESDSEEWGGGGVRRMGGASTGDPVSRGAPSTSNTSIPRDGSDWSAGDMAAAILNGYVFMCGDLNYRVKMSPEQAVLLIAKGESRRIKGGVEPPVQSLGGNMTMLRDTNAALKGSKGARSKGMPLPDWLDPERPWRRIILMEELRAEMTWGNLWLGWEEAAICFPPTYRRVREAGAVLRRVRGDYADLRRVAHGYATHLAKGGGILHGRAALPFVAGRGGTGGFTLSPTGAATLDGPLKGGSGSRRGSRSAVRPAAVAGGTHRGQHRSPSVSTRDLVMQMPKGARGGKAAAWLGASERRASKGVKGGFTTDDIEHDDSDGADSVTSVASASAPPSTSLLGGPRRPGIQFATGTREQDGTTISSPRKGATSGELSRVPSVRTRAFVSLGGGSDDDLDGELTHLDVPLQPHLLSPPVKATEAVAKKPTKKFRLSMAPGAAPAGSSGPKTRRRSVMPTPLGGVAQGGPGAGNAPPSRQASLDAFPVPESQPAEVAPAGGGATAPPVAPSRAGTFKRLRQSIVGGAGMSQSTRNLRVGTSAPGASEGVEGGVEEGVKITTRTPSYTDRILVRRPLSQQPPVVRAQVLPDWVMPGGIGPRSSMYGALTSLWQPGTGTGARGFVQDGHGEGGPMHPRTGTMASNNGVHVRSERAASDGSVHSVHSVNLFDSARASGTALPSHLLGMGEGAMGPEAAGGGLRMGASDVLVPLPAKPPVLPPLLWSRYDMADEVLGSDHVPVIAEFELDLNASVRGTPELGTRMGGLLSQGGTFACDLLEASSVLQRITAKEAARSQLPTAGGAPLHPMQDATAVLAAQLHGLREKIPPAPPKTARKAPPPAPFRPDGVSGSDSNLASMTGVAADHSFSDDGDSDVESGTLSPLGGGIGGGSAVSAVAGEVSSATATRDAMRMSFHAGPLGGVRTVPSNSSMDSGSGGGGGGGGAAVDTTSSSVSGGGNSPAHKTPAQVALSDTLVHHLCDPARLALGKEIEAAHHQLKFGGAAALGDTAAEESSPQEVDSSSFLPATSRMLSTIMHVQEPTVDELFEALLPSKTATAMAPPPAARRVFPHQSMGAGARGTKSGAAQPESVKEVQ